MERRLGRGLSSLLPSGGSSPKPQPATTVTPAAAPPSSSGPARWLPIGDVRPNPFQPRRHFDPEALEELRLSLQTHGMLQPVVVRPSGTGFELVAGERRWRAAKLAGMQTLPAVVKEGATDAQMLEWAMVENLQRRDLDPIERALGYQAMVEQLDLTQSEVAERVGLRRSTVTNHLRLLELGSGPQSLVREGTLSMGHARALLGLEDAEGRDRLAQDAVAGGLSVREVERRVRELAGRAPEESSPASATTSKSVTGRSAAHGSATPPWAKELERRLLEKLGTRVEIEERGGYRGRIVLHYADREALDQLLEELL